MGRRRELRGVCNDLLESFVSRHNDLDGYWALGKFQAFLQSKPTNCLVFDLTSEDNGERLFLQTLDYYRMAFRRHLAIRKIPAAHVTSAVIRSEQLTTLKLLCAFKITVDNGQTFEARRLVSARPHNPNIERRRRLPHGPSNQKGV
mgnify:CR=1 FL=1